jgi:segregation and condensation protein A
LADYRVNLDIFAGPLDLLLYLVRKEEVDIYDIPLAKITDQYLQYAEMLKQFDIDLAGDFLVMAATLMEIKSAMLLPRVEPEDMAAEDAGDPRAELIRQLLEYKKFKDAANLLDAAAATQEQRHGRPTSLVERLEPDAEPELDMDQISVWDLLEAFDTVCKAIGTTTYTGHIVDDTPIDLYQIEILHRLQTEGAMTFERVFESRPNRLVMVGLFLAMLELIRDKLIWAEQGPEAPHQIYLRALTDEPAEKAVQRAIVAIDEEETALEAGQAQKPPIPITEIPAHPKPSAPVPQQASHAEQQAEAPATELDSPPAEPATPDTGHSTTQPHAEPAAEPPIPIAELPPKPQTQADQPQPHQAANDRSDTDEDDLAFDKP